MERIIVFSSEVDAGEEFTNAICEPWNQFGFGNEVNWVVFSNGYMDTSTRKPKKFDMLLVCEPSDIIDENGEYEETLSEIARGFDTLTKDDDLLLVLHHEKTNNAYKEIQRKFVEGLPGHYIRSGEYSHSTSDDRYQAIASLMEAGRNPNARPKYPRRLSKLLAALSFPMLYDQAGSIQMRLFLQYCQNFSGTQEVKSVDLTELPQLYKEFASAARIRNPKLDEISLNSQDEIVVPKSLEILCANDTKQVERRESMNNFDQHLNKILLSVSGTR